MARTSAVTRCSLHSTGGRPSSTKYSTAIDNSGRGGNIRTHGSAWRFQRGPALGAAGRVRKARVIDAGQQGHERLLDAREVAQRQVALVELAFFQALMDDALDQVLDRLARMVARGARRG